MRAVLEHLTADDEVGLVRFGQSNGRPQGHRDKEGFVAAPHLKLRAAGLDLTIAAIASTDGAAHGAIATRSIVTVAETLAANDWINGELRLVQHEWGDAVTSSLRVGHAKVLANTAVASLSSLAAVPLAGLLFDATANTVYWPNHGRANGSQVSFTATGTAVLPTGLTAGPIYWVRDATQHTFKVSADPFGAAVVLGTAGTSTATDLLTVTARAYLLVEWLSAFQAAATVTFDNGSGSLRCNLVGHGRTAGSTVSFAGASLPTGIVAATTYYVVSPTADTFLLSATYGGAAIAFATAGSGTITATPGMLRHVSGYVHLHDRFNSYGNVHIVTPYQPIEPGDYPAGTPVVPGFTLPADVTSYADAAVVLPFAWNEGIEGHGAVGTATVVGLTVTLVTGGPLTATLFAGGFIRLGNAKGKVATNAAGTVTVESWTPSAGPGAGTLPFELHLPHWRNNPHHHTAGEGFLYPSSDMQPGGNTSASNGQVYSRPRGRLVGSYVARALNTTTVSSAINGASGNAAQCKTNASAQITASIVGGKLRLQRADSANDVATGLIQFEHYLRPGYIVLLSGMGQTPSINTFWRVDALQHTAGATGSYVDLIQLDPTTSAVPAAVSGAVPSGATVARVVFDLQHRFGSLLETCWRLAMAIGRRVVAAHLCINSAGLVLASTNNTAGFQGKIGWRDDDQSLDWTPSNSDAASNAARLKRLVEFIAPRAVQASFGTAKKWKVVAGDIWDGETDAITAAGRELAPRSIPTQAKWLRSLIEAAGLSPYRQGARIPLHWAQVSPAFEGAGGDTTGAFNAALDRFVAVDGFMASVNTDSAGKLDGTTFWGADPLHFNGFGEAANAKAAAALLVDLIDFAFSFALGPAGVAIANQALSILGDSPNVTALEPANNTQQARLAAQFLPQARAAVLSKHIWTFSRRRRPLVALVANEASTWTYAYAVPPELLNPAKVLDPAAPDDLQIRAEKAPDQITSVVTTGDTQLAGQPYQIETDLDGNRILRTDQENAVCVFSGVNTDFSLWDPLVAQACAFYLAHLMSGGVVKGKTGVQIAGSHLATSEALMRQAAAQNAEFHADVRVTPTCDWLP